MADNSQLTAKEILELRSLIKLLGKDIEDIDFNNLIKSGSAARDYLHKLQAEAEEFTSDISFSITAFQNIANELKNTYSGVNNVTKIYKGLTSIAQELQYHQQNISKLDEKGIEKLREKFEINQLELKNADSLLKLEEQSLEAQLKKAKKDKEAVEAEADRLSDLEKHGKLTEEQKKRYDELVKQYAQIEKSEKNINKLLGQNRSTQNEIKGALEEQDGLYNTLRATIDGIDSQLEKQKKLLGLSGAAVEGLSSALNNLGFSSLSNQLGIDEAKSKMSSLAEKIVKDQKQQIILQEQINAAKENLPTGRYDNLLKKLEREKELEKEIEEIRSKGGDEKKLKAKEKALESIKAGYTEEEKVLGQNITNLNTLTKSNAQYTGMKGKVAVLNEGLKSMGSSLVKNLTDPLTITTFLVTQLVGALKSSDAATGELAKQFGTSYKEALGIRKELNEIANSTGNVNINSQNLQKSLTEINKAFGTNAKISQEELITMTELTQQAGYQAEELTGIYKISKATGKDFKDNTKAILGTAVAFNAVNKSAINEREVLKEVNKTSNAVKLSLGGSLEAVTKSVMQAKQFGLNLEQAESISKGLLEFESSISSELEAEMLTGKSLNFEKARLLALNNDIAGAAAEVAKQVGSSAEFGKMNRIQQEALAKAVGLTRDQLADSLVEREALTKLGAQEGTALEAYNKLKKEGLSDEAIAAKLGDDKLAAQLESQSVQEQFNATVEKLKEIFVSLSEPILNMVNSLTPVFNIIGGIASGIGTVINFFNKITGGTLPAIIGLMLTWKLLTGGIGQGILGIGKSLKDTVLGAAKGVGSIFSSIKEKGIGGTAKDLKDSIKNKFSGKSKVDDLADKAKDNGNKASNSTKGGDNAKGFADKMKNIAKGVKAFGDAKVILGALIGLPAAAVGLIAMLPGVLGAKAIEALNGKKIKSSLEGLAEGIKAMASGKVAAGAGALILASIGLTAMLPGVLGALAIQSIDGKKIKKSLEGLAEGIEAFGKGKITGGVANLIVASVGLTAMIIGTLGAKVIEKIDGKAVKKALEGLAAGIESFGSGKITGGSANLIVASVGLTAMIVGTLGAKVIEKIDGKAVKKALEGVSEGLEAMANSKVALGALALTVVSAGLTLMIPGAIGAKIIEKIDGKGVKKGLEGLADGLEAMAKGKVLLGAGALAVASIGLVAALPGMLAAAALGAIGPLVEKGLKSFASGIERLASGKVFLGALALAALGAALIPAAYAFKMFSEVSWEDMGKAGVALVGLGIAGAVFGSLVGLMLAGAVAIAALGASLIPFGIALNLIAPALEKFTPVIEAFGNVISKTFSGIAEVITSAFDGLSNLFKTLSEVDPIKLFAIGPALASIGAGLAVLGGGSLAGGILGSIGKLFGGGVVEKLNELSSIDSSKILTLADAITKLSESIANLNNVTANVGDVSPIITTVDKVVELHDSLNKTSLEKVVDKVSEGVSSLFSKAFEFVSSVSSTDKTASNTESTISASSLSSAASSKSLVDKTNIEAKEVILNVSDKAKEINTKLASSDKIKDLEKTKKTVGEFDVNKLQEELLTNEKTNELLAASVDNLKVTNLIVEKQSTEKTKESTLDKASGVIGGAMAGAEIGGLFGPLGMLAGGLIGGAASLFGGNEEEITPINNETQIQSQTLTSPNNNVTTSTLTNNNQNVTSNDNVVKILQEAVTVLKAIQSKDTSVQLAIDGDVIAKKITPNVNREQVRTYSSIS
jgi:hypothetical protein